MKECNKCHEVKTLSEFYKRATSIDGHRNDCKSCNLALKKKYRDSNQEKCVERSRKYRELHRDDLARKKREYYHANKEEIKERRRPYFELESTKEAARNRSSEYYLNNKEKARAANNSYKEANKEKWNEYGRNYYFNNKESLSEKRKVYSRKRYIENKEIININTRSWKNNNKERIALKNREWLSKNRDKANHVCARRRAKKFKATPSWANEFFIKEAYELAKLRTELHGFKWQVDHIVPINSPIVQGLHCEANLQVIPWKENISKGNRYWPDMP